MIGGEKEICGGYTAEYIKKFIENSPAKHRHDRRRDKRVTHSLIYQKFHGKLTS